MLAPGEGGGLVGEHEVQDEDDASEDGEDAGGHGAAGQRHRAHRQEDHAAHQVDDQLKDGDVAADEVGDEDGGHDDGVAHSGALAGVEGGAHLAQEIGVYAPEVAIPVEPHNHEHHEDEDLVRG